MTDLQNVLTNTETDKQGNHVGPKTDISYTVHAEKYRGTEERFYEYATRVASALQDDNEHFNAFRQGLLQQRILPAGRVQSDIGSPHATTAFNCFVSGTIRDSGASIMEKATEAFETMRRGGGIGYDFSRLRPRGTNIASLGSQSSGPVSFMAIFDAICQTIASAGHRRGAQMGVLRIDHPDIMEFVRVKHDLSRLTGFNLSVAVTDQFMHCLREKMPFDLKFEDKVYATVNPESLWDEIMRSTWDYAEPGVLFIDRINHMNNLWYCETIEATNPCGEQPLPPYGACLLGSINLVKYCSNHSFDEELYREDIHNFVNAMDNVVDNTGYPLLDQEFEAKQKRRMGIGVTGLANAGEYLGLHYGTDSMLGWTEEVLSTLANESYRASTLRARDRGAFPAFKKDLYMQSRYIAQLPEDVRNLIFQHGTRNSHLTSIAPTGTISLAADNVSSGIEPPFLLTYDRVMQTRDGPVTLRVDDYAFREWGIKGRTADECTAQEHLQVLGVAARHMDSSVSKTCNVGDDVLFEDFKDLYVGAYEIGAKGVTTFRASGKRYGILTKPVETDGPKAEACFIDPLTGSKTCD